MTTTTPHDTPVSLHDQWQEAVRELAMRRRVYPRWVRQDHLMPDRAAYQLRVQEAIVATLKRLLDHDDAHSGQYQLFGGSSVP